MFKAFGQNKPTRFPNFEWEPIEGTNSQVIQSYKGDFFSWIPEGRYLIKSGYDAGFHQFISKPEYGEKIEGFWVNTFALSQDSNGYFHSIPNADPFKYACPGEMTEEIAKSMGGEIISVQQYRRIFTWLIDSGIVTLEQVYQDSSEIGHYNSLEILKTGSNPKLMLGNIDCLAGNMRCLIKIKANIYFVAGGCYTESGRVYPVGSLWSSDIIGCYGIPTQIRVVL